MNSRTITTDLIPQPILLETAGVSSVTFNSWRRRNGLFPRTTAVRKWNRYTQVEALATTILVDLTRSGITAQRAVDMAMKAMPAIERFMSGEEDYNILAFTKLTHDDFEIIAGGFEVPLASLLLFDKNTTPIIVIDLSTTLIGFVERFTGIVQIAARNPDKYKFEGPDIDEQ